MSDTNEIVIVAERLREVVTGLLSKTSQTPSGVELNARCLLVLHLLDKGQVEDALRVATTLTEIWSMPIRFFYDGQRWREIPEEFRASDQDYGVQCAPLLSED